MKSRLYPWQTLVGTALLALAGCNAFGDFNNPNDSMGTNYKPLLAVPGPVYLMAARDATTKKAFLAYQLPADAALATVSVTYWDNSVTPSSPVTVDLGVGPRPLGAYSPDPLATSPSANNRYFEPNVPAGAAFTFQLTMVATDGRRSNPQTAANSDIGSPGVTFSLASYQTLAFTSTSLTMAAGGSLVIAPSPGTLATAGTAWNWYVNGAASGNTSSYTFTPAAPGFYVVEVTVIYSGVLYSGSLSVTVTQ